MLFSDIVGQEDIKNRLIKSVEENRIPHAQMFVGKAGVGELQLALGYARYLQCTQRTANDACGQCPSCQKFDKLEHADLHFVFPVIKPENRRTVVCDDFVSDFRNIIIEKQYFDVQEWYKTISKGNKQGVIYANESAEILRKLSTKPYEGGYKIMIIWLPELMNLECANKILKIIEEPPKDTIFLLVSNQLDGVLPTIVSRTQQILVPQISTENIVAKLMQKYPHSSAKEIDNSARIAGGSYLQATKVIENNSENLQHFDMFVEIMRLAWMVGNRADHKSLKTLRQISEDIASAGVGREGQKTFLSYAQKLMRENFIYNLKVPEINYMTSYEQEFATKFSPFINVKNIEDLVAELATAERQIAQNANPKIVFFDLILKIIVYLKR